MKKLILITINFCFAFAMLMNLSNQLIAEEGGWSWGPFSSSTKKSDAGVMDKSASKSTSGSWTPDWKVPDIAGGIKRTGQVVTAKTSAAWESTTRTTKRAWKKTTEVLDPFPDTPKSNNSSPWAAGGSSSNSTTSKTKSSSGSMFDWFGSKDSNPDKPSTPQDFLRQDRP